VGVSEQPANRTHLDLVDISHNTPHPTGARQRAILVNADDAAVLETANDDLETLCNVALDQPGNALSSNSHELVATEHLGQELSTTKKEGVDVLDDSVE